MIWKTNDVMIKKQFVSKMKTTENEELEVICFLNMKVLRIFIN